MSDNIMPANIRMNAGKDFTPSHIEVVDDATGEKVLGVLHVNIMLSHSQMMVEVTHTQHWPTTDADYAVNMTEEELEDKVVVQGVACVVTQYWLKQFIGTAIKTEWISE